MFDKAWYIGSFANIPVKIHWSFLLILLYVGISSATQGAGVEAIIIELCFVLAMFLCVVLHEFGHALTAKRYGIKTEDIILLPIGGVARLRNMPEKPMQELVIAVMGPFVNIVIAFSLFFILLGGKGINYFSLEQLDQVDFNNWSGFLPLLMVSNIMLVLFNMIPAFPMDGGRVFRALLSMGFGRLKATRYASITGQVICVILIGIGMYYGAYTLAIIGVFIFFSASQEYRSVLLDAAMKQKTIADCYRKHFTSLTEYTTVREAFQTLLHTSERYFPVINLFGTYCGWVNAAHVRAAFKRDPDVRIGDICVRNLLSMHSDTQLITALYSLRGDSELMLVVDEDQVVGVLDRDAVQHYLEMVG